MIFQAGQAASAQQAFITGRVVDAETSTPLPGVNVFLDQTLLGASTNGHGIFRIERIAPGSYSVVASMVGYSAETSPVEVVPEIVDYQIDFRIHEAVLRMDEVEVTAERPRRWKRNLRRFEDLFLGRSGNARQTRILNPYVLDFETGDGAFTASASEPLEIENMALGYRITFVLTEFRFESDLLYLQGPFHFQELEAATEAETLRWKVNRAQTYRGSLQHLLTSLIQGIATMEGFSVELDQRPNAPYSKELPDFKSIEGLGVISSGDRPYLYHLQFPHHLRVTYSGDRSWIRMNRSAATLHESGYVYGSASLSGALTVYGSLAKRRVADLLPRDYEISD